MKKTITTIIPIYNNGKDLGRMLDSILTGSLLPDEIILVDDGSTDNSIDVEKEYANRYPFIKCMPQPHSGVSAARNLGLKNATGEWISFLDADDYIENNFYESMLASLTDDSLSGCICGYFTELDGISTPYSGNYPHIIDSSTFKKAMFTDDNVRGFLVTRLFKRELIKDISFNTNISMCEDLLFQSTLLARCDDLKFGYVNLPLYHYIQNTSSATNSINLFNGDVFKYKPAFDEIRKLIPEIYVEDSYDSILQYSMYRLLKAYKSGNRDVLPQIRGVQQELKNTHPSHISKRRMAYKIAPILYSRFIPS
jgi:glycosyltransferase involved in cell wall biosynthesis